MPTKYTKERLEEVCRQSSSIAGVLRILGLKQAGGSQSYIKRKLLKYGIDMSHLSGQGHLKGKSSPRKKSADEILVVSEATQFRTRHYQLKRALLEKGVVEKCSICGVPPIWNGKHLTLEIDHIDGNFLNNKFENLRFVCPNCHSQLETSKPYKKPQ